LDIWKVLQIVPPLGHQLKGGGNNALFLGDNWLSVEFPRIILSLKEV